MKAYCTLTTFLGELFVLRVINNALFILLLSEVLPRTPHLCRVAYCFDCALDILLLTQLL